jgi:AcrR family transcriptional regulator
LILPKSNLRQQKKPGRTPRRRRTKEEIIERLMEAAGEEFEHNGYAGTTTAAIAQKAGVAEWLIFNHFGSKAKLFHDAIFKPMNQQFVDFFNTRQADTEDARQETARQYILELQRFMARHSKMLMSLLFAQIYEGDKVEGLSQVDGLHDYFSRAAAMAMNRLSGKPKVDPKLMGRFSFATIMACVIFKDLLFPEGLATKDEISAGMTDFIMFGSRANANPVPKLKAR